jgi:hypothetical protein
VRDLLVASPWIKKCFSLPWAFVKLDSDLRMKKSTPERSDGGDTFIPESVQISGEKVTAESGDGNVGEAGEWEEETPTVRERSPFP